MTDLAAALAAFAPQIADRYASQVRAMLAGFVRRHGENLRGIANTSDYRAWANVVRPVCKTIGGNTVAGRQTAPTYAIDDDKLSQAAAAYAEATVTEWQGKIEAKLGELEGATVLRMNGVGFVIKGSRAGRAVAIEQQMIVKASTKGLLFNQFPARIYVSGKFTPEAAYKRMFAA